MTLWQDLADLFLPNRADFTTEQMAGQDRQENLFDSGPQLAARGLASAIATMLRPAGKTWFKAKCKDESLNQLEAVRMWLYAVTQITYNALYDPRVNADKVLSEVDNDLVVFGTGVASINWDKAKGHLTIKSKSLANTALLAGKDGNPNGIASRHKMTLRQIVEQFGEEKLTDKMRDAYQRPDAKLDQEFEILHVVIPNKDARALGAGRVKFPFASLWLAPMEKEVLDEGGFWDFPDITPRWDTLTGEVYGRSPAMIALADARVVQAMAKTFLEAGEMSLRPPTWSYADMIQGDLQMFPGGHTVVDMSGFQGTGAPIQALQIGAFPDKIFEVYTRKNENISAAFFRDIMELPSARDGDMTATEINARMDQFLRQAAPVFARVEHTYNAPLVNRVFNLLWREKQYPPPPEELFANGEEIEIEFEYESPIKAAREKAEALKVVEGVGMMLPYAEANPEVLDNIDFDATVRFIGVKADLPQAIFTPIEKMMEMRAERAKKLDQAQKAEMMSKVGPAMAKIGDTAIRAKEGGMLGFDDPMQLPAPGLTPGMDEMEGEVLEGIYEQVA